jgi:hypothetical protein
MPSRTRCEATAPRSSASDPFACGAFGDTVSPGALRLRLDDGIGAAPTATPNIGLSVRGEDTVHDGDEADRALRWEVFPHEYTGPGERWVLFVVPADDVAAIIDAFVTGLGEERPLRLLPARQTVHGKKR